MNWTVLSAANDAVRPSARAGHGFTSSAGRLYVHGGFGIEDSGGYGEANNIYWVNMFINYTVYCKVKNVFIFSNAFL